MADRAAASGTTERLLRRTRRRLFGLTMALLALLVVGIGATTAVVALRALDGDVDRALVDAVQTRAGTGKIETGDSSGHSTDSSNPDLDRTAGQSDTFILALDRKGAVVENRSNITLAGLPDAAALTAAGRGGSDLRTITAGGTDIRLYTVTVSHDGKAQGYIQGGILLTLHDRQSQTLVLSVASVGVAGLVAAALITLLLTDRALRPVREAFEAQRRFVADASHELRTPAALIRANAEVLEREGLVSDSGRDLAGDIMAEADRLGQLVGDLLQMAAWDETSLVLAPVALDAASLAADTVRGATALAAEHGVLLRHEAPGPVYARADRGRLVQLLLILIDNAVAHAPRDTTVTVRVGRAGTETVIEVEDQGPGIPTTERERIFEPFTRLSGRTRHGSGGTGLGLAIARRIAGAMHGTIAVTSPEGAGARFRVSLPAAEPGRRAAADAG